MISLPRIQAYADRIAETFHPDKIILFGPYAYGNPTEDSDVDMLVSMPFEGRERAKSMEIKRSVGVDCAMDLLVYNPAHLQKRLE